MLFTKTTIAALFAASSALAAPRGFTTQSEVPEWSLNSLSRPCNDADTECTWTFDIDQNLEDVDIVSCEFLVEAADGVPASQTPFAPSGYCEQYRIEAGYDASGFTTLTIVDDGEGMLAWFGYNDAEIADGRTVQPDKDEPPQSIA